MSLSNSAAGADLLSSEFCVSTSPAGANQMPRKGAEPERVPAISKAQAGGHRVTRRTLMNSLVALPIAASVPISSPDLQTTSPRPDRRALEAYASWLFMERRLLCNEL
jgi:hypothetical protein